MAKTEIEMINGRALADLKARKAAEECAAVLEQLQQGQIPDPGGNVDFQIDETLSLKNGILSVNTIDQVIEDDARPVTSGAVYQEFSKAVALLKTI